MEKRANLCSVALLHFRAKERLEEDERMRKACASAPVMQDLQPVLQKVQVAAKKGPAALIQHVYKHHPPKNGDATCPTDFSDGAMKKVRSARAQLLSRSRDQVECQHLDVAASPCHCALYRSAGF